MPNYVCNGAKMSCSFGSSSASLTVLPTKRIQLEDNEMADIMDFKPMVNIPGFGQCSSLVNPLVAAATAKNSGVLEPQKCIPVLTSQWIPGHPTVSIANQSALMDFCINFCAYFGVITITDAGQTSVSSEMAAPNMGAAIAAATAGMEEAAEKAKEQAKKDIAEEAAKAANANK